MVEAVVDGVKAGLKDYQVKIKLIGILSRSFGQQACTQELDGLLAHRESLVAVDLAGDELGFPGELFNEHFKRVRDAGLQITLTPEKPPVPKACGKPSRSWGRLA